MNKRERLLMLAVGLAAALLFGFFGVRWVWGKFSVRNAEIAKLEKESGEQQRQINQGKPTIKRLARYQERALPEELNQARALYSEFLFDTADDLAGLRDVNVTPSPATGKKGVYQTLRFQLKAEGNLEQLTMFLYYFYSVDYLHRIQNMTVQPHEKKKDLQLTFTIEALSLTGAASRTELDSAPAERLILASEADYLRVILNRNLFSPPNQPPQFASLGTQQATTKKHFTIDLAATDNDVLDRVKFEIDSPTAQGFVLEPGEDSKPGEPQTAKVSWTPKEKGEYTFSVWATDDGVPARQVEQTFKVVVSDPKPTIVDTRPKPPPPLKFDVAKHTYLTSILETDGEMGIWLIERTTGKRVELREGDKFEIGSMKGVVTKIGHQRVEIEVGGKRLVLALGSSLFEAAALEL